MMSYYDFLEGPTAATSRTFYKNGISSKLNSKIERLSIENAVEIETVVRRQGKVLQASKVDFSAAK